MSMLEILVVDDDGMSRQMAEFMLKQGGYKAFPLESGEKALSVLENNDYALILLDVDMPGKDGIESLKCIRDMPKPKSDIPVIFLTGDTSEKTVIDAALLNALGYIQKPFFPEDLLSKVNDVLASNKDSY